MLPGPKGQVKVRGGKNENTELENFTASLVIFISLAAITVSVSIIIITQKRDRLLDMKAATTPPSEANGRIELC